MYKSFFSFEAENIKTSRVFSIKCLRKDIHQKLLEMFHNNEFNYYDSFYNAALISRVLKCDIVESNYSNFGGGWSAWNSLGGIDFDISELLYPKLFPKNTYIACFFVRGKWEELSKSIPMQPNQSDIERSFLEDIYFNIHGEKCLNQLTRESFSQVKRRIKNHADYRTYEQFENENIKVVRTVPIGSYPDWMRAKLESIRDKLIFTDNQCYTNAWTIATELGCEYVEGFCSADPGPSTHAFNKINGFYFDFVNQSMNGIDKPVNLLAVVEGELDQLRIDYPFEYAHCGDEPRSFLRSIHFHLHGYDSLYRLVFELELFEESGEKENAGEWVHRIRNHPNISEPDYRLVVPCNSVYEAYYPGNSYSKFLAL
jgi:hypothetical protein